MDIDSYIRVIRSHLRLVVICILGGALVATVIEWTNPPTYEATLQLYGSAGGIPSKEESAYEGQRYAQQRMRSYASLLSGRAGAEAVRRQLGLSATVGSIRQKIRVSVPPNSTLATIAARDSSPQLARAMVEALGDQAPKLIASLETPAKGERPSLYLRVTSPARVPTSPVAPRIAYLALGVLLGLVGGVGIAVFLDRLDDRIRDEGDVWAATGARVLGRIGDQPRQERSPVMSASAHSPNAEAYRSLRANLVMVGGEHDARALVVSSAVPGEGKTEVVANVGLALAQAGERVALVDANLRSPRLAPLLGMAPGPGLTDLLEGQLGLNSALLPHPVGSLDLLAGGSPRPHPTELIGSKRFKSLLGELTDRFDWVLIDTPAILPVTDALVIARSAPGMILVTRAASTRLRELKQARQAVRMVETPVLGVVLNRVSSLNNEIYSRHQHLPADQQPTPTTLIRPGIHGKA